MGIAFPAAVAGVGHAHQPGVEPVLDIALQYAVVDQHVALRRRALVIDGQRSAPSLDGAVVDHRHARCGHALADPPGEDRKSVGWGKSVSVRVGLGARRCSKKKITYKKNLKLLL